MYFYGKLFIDISYIKIMAYNNYNYDNSAYDKELGFKYHTQEFLDVSQELRRVGHMGRLAKKQIGAVQDFLDGIEYLDEIYSSYFTDTKWVIEELKACEVLLERKPYRKMLNDYFSLEYEDNELKERLLIYERAVIRRLKKIFKRISDDLVWAELRPRPSKIIKDEFADEENKVIKEIMAGVKAGLKRN